MGSCMITDDYKERMVFFFLLCLYHICNKIKPQPLDLTGIKRQARGRENKMNTQKVKPAYDRRFITTQVVLHYSRDL